MPRGMKTARFGRREPATDHEIDDDLDALFHAAVERGPDAEQRGWADEVAELRRELRETDAELRKVTGERDRLARARHHDLLRASAAVDDLTARLHRLADA